MKIREIYNFIRETIQIQNPRILNQQEIPGYEYFVILTTLNKKGFYVLLYEVYKDEKANKVIEKILKSTTFLR